MLVEAVVPGGGRWDSSTEVAGGWELPDVDAGDQIWGLCKSCFHSVTELSFLSLGF